MDEARRAVAPGVEEVTFVQIDAFGVDMWLAGLREELVSKSSTGINPNPLK